MQKQENKLPFFSSKEARRLEKTQLEFSIITKRKGAEFKKLLTQIKKTALIKILFPDAVDDLISIENSLSKKDNNILSATSPKIEANADKKEDVINYSSLLSENTIEEKFVELEKKYNFFSKDSNTSIQAKKIFCMFFSVTKIVADFIENNSDNKDDLAYLHAYKMLIVFRQDLSAANPFAAFEKYLISYNYADYRNPVHDALVPSLPQQGQTIHLDDWRKMIINIGPKALVLFEIADKIEEKLQRFPNNFEEAQQIALQLTYKKADEYPELAKLCISLKVPEELFEKCLAMQKDGIKKSDNLPNIIIDGNKINKDTAGYFLVKLPIDDPRAYLLGYLTLCCQSIGKEGENCVRGGLQLPNAGFYVLLQQLRDNQKPFFQGKINYDDFKIVGQSYAWLSDNGNLVFDSWENRNPEKTDVIAIKLLESFTQVVVENPASPIFRVSIGKGGKTPAVYKNMPDMEDLETISSGTMHYHPWYADSTKQALIGKATNKLQILINQIKEKTGKTVDLNHIHCHFQYALIEKLLNEQVEVLIEILQQDAGAKLKEIVSINFLTEIYFINAIETLPEIIEEKNKEIIEKEAPEKRNFSQIILDLIRKSKLLKELFLLRNAAGNSVLECTISTAIDSVDLKNIKLILQEAREQNILHECVTAKHPLLQSNLLMSAAITGNIETFNIILDVGQELNLLTHWLPDQTIHKHNLLSYGVIGKSMDIFKRILLLGEDSNELKNWIIAPNATITPSTTISINPVLFSTLAQSTKEIVQQVMLLIEEYNLLEAFLFYNPREYMAFYAPLLLRNFAVHGTEETLGYLLDLYAEKSLLERLDKEVKGTEKNPFGYLMEELLYSALENKNLSTVKTIFKWSLQKNILIKALFHDGIIYDALPNIFLCTDNQEIFSWVIAYLHQEKLLELCLMRTFYDQDSLECDFSLLSYTINLITSRKEDSCFKLLLSYFDQEPQLLKNVLTQKPEVQQLSFSFAAPLSLCFKMAETEETIWSLLNILEKHKVDFIELLLDIDVFNCALEMGYIKIINKTLQLISFDGPYLEQSIRIFSDPKILSTLISTGEDELVEHFIQNAVELGCLEKILTVQCLSIAASDSDQKLVVQGLQTLNVKEIQAPPERIKIFSDLLNIANKYQLLPTLLKTTSDYDYGSDETYHVMEVCAKNTAPQKIKMIFEIIKTWKQEDLVPLFPAKILSPSPTSAVLQEIINFLLEKNLVVPFLCQQDGEVPLPFLTRVFLRWKSNASTTTIENFNLLLIAAAKIGKLEDILNMRDKENRTISMIIANHGEIEFLKKILEIAEKNNLLPSILDATDTMGRNIFMYTCIPKVKISSGFDDDLDIDGFDFDFDFMDDLRFGFGQRENKKINKNNLFFEDPQKGKKITMALHLLEYTTSHGLFDKLILMLDKKEQNFLNYTINYGFSKLTQKIQELQKSPNLKIELKVEN